MTKEDYVASGKRVLTLQIDNRCFHDILEGKQDVETRWIRPHTAPMYLTYIADGKEYKSEADVPDTAEQVEFNPIEYDAMYLINGRKADAPRLLVEIESEEIVFFAQEGDQIVEIAPDDTESVPAQFEEKGKLYTYAQIWYYLGKVLFSENLQNLK